MTDLNARLIELHKQLETSVNKDKLWDEIRKINYEMHNKHGHTITNHWNTLNHHRVDDGREKEGG